MSAARQFALEPTGPPVRCDFPGCILDAWHDGDHQFAPPVAIEWPKNTYHFSPANEGKKWEAPLLCRCPQREYPHELSVHTQISSEWFAHRKNPSWPWSLMLSPKVEMSTERKFT
jgi:hypothetical protein